MNVIHELGSEIGLFRSVSPLNVAASVTLYLFAEV
ncbi:hypothetical protein PC116_g16157 [Phytophthora cactorum]|nr:hypothetical protein PC116_g16157 [Phytophthora cactorum]